MSKEHYTIDKPLTGDLVITASVEQPGDDTKTSLSGTSVSWTEGDQIILYDKNGHSETFRAISAGTTTTFEKVDAGASTLAEGDIYAYYPADKVASFDNTSKAFTATIPAVQAYKAESFSDGVNPMTAKGTLSGSTLALSFKNVLSYIKLQISGCSASEIMTGFSVTANENLNGTATVTVGSKGVSTVSLSSGTNTIEVFGLSVNSSSATPIYVAVPAGNHTDLTIKAITAKADGFYSKTHSSTHNLSTERSKIHRYNTIAISAFPAGTKIAEPAANCYMVAKGSSATSINIPLYQAIAGWNAVKTLEPSDKFDMSKIVSGTRDVAVRWFDGASGTISKNSIDGSVLTLSLNPDANGSNAIVDLKNGDDIVWSWHIWFTDYEPAANQASTVNGQVHTYSGAAFQSGGLYHGKVMMDRNLGATITGFTEDLSTNPSSIDAIKYWGLYYQFGRKDPFPTYDNATFTPTYVEVTTSKKTYAYAAQHPAEYFYTTNSADAWASTDVDASQATDPWKADGTKSMFDPCPYGWRIPNNGSTTNKNVWTGLSKDYYVIATNPTGGVLWNGVWLPGTGNRTRASGIPNGNGTSVYFWSSSVGSFKGGAVYCAVMYNYCTTSGIADGSRCFGMPVRCIKE